MQTIKQEINDLVKESIKGLAAEIVKDIQAALRTKAAKKHDRTLETLKSTIKALRDQLATKQSNSDDLLDDLYVKTVARTHEIETKGISVTFGTSERHYKALPISADTWHFVPGTPLTIGTEIKSDRGGPCIVIAIKQKAGRIEAMTFNPYSTCQSYSMTKTLTGSNLKAEGTNVPCNFENGKLTTFNHRYPSSTILKLGECFYVVGGSYQDGLLAVHQLKLYEGLKQASIPTPNFYVDNGTQKNYSLYHSTIM